MDGIVNIPVERQRSLLEMFLTAWSPLTESLDIQAGQTLLVRGGTSSIGLTSVAVAKNAGLTVLATTRSEKKKQAVLDARSEERRVGKECRLGWSRDK